MNLKNKFINFFSNFADSINIKRKCFQTNIKYTTKMYTHELYNFIKKSLFGVDTTHLLVANY